MTDQPDSWLAGWRGSIRYRLMAWGLGLLAAALLINTVIGSVYTRTQIRHAAAELQAQVASTTARRVESYVAHKLERLHDAAVGMSIHPVGGDAQRSLGLRLIKNDATFAEIAVLNADGLVALKFSETNLYSGADLQDLHTTALFREASRGKKFVSAVSTSEQGEPFLTLAVPLKTEPKDGGGGVAAKVNLQFLRDTFSELHFGHGGYAYLIDKSGSVIAHRDTSTVLKRVNLKGQPKFTGFIETGTPDGNPGGEERGIGGTQVLSTYAIVNELGWAVVVEEPAQPALADLAKFHRNGGVLLIAILAVGALVIVWLSGKITRPIQELRAGVAIMAHGNLEHRASVKTNDEIGQLAGEFNKMADVLKSSYANLEQRIEQRTGQVAALYGVTKTVNQSLDLDRVLQQVVEQITQIFHFDTTRIYLFDAERENLISRALFETHPESWTGIQRFSKGQSLVGHVAETGEALIFDDVQSDPRYAQISASNASRDAGFHFLAMLPIKIHGKLLGTLGLSGKDKRILAEEELRLLISMCEHIALAVEKVNLFDQVMTRSGQLEVLNTIGAAVSQSLNLDEVLDQAVDKIAKAVGLDAAWIYQLNAAGGVLRMKAFHGLSDDMAASMATLAVDAAVSGQVIKTGERLIFEDIQNDERYRALSQQGKVVPLGVCKRGGVSDNGKRENHRHSARRQSSQARFCRRRN